jgi:hypothetical protein
MMNAVSVINQLFEMQVKMKEKGISTDFERNFNRLYHVFEEEGYLVQDPTGETYSETRTDYEASISGRVSARMQISRTIKPIIYLKKDGAVTLIQKGVVIAENP